MLDTVPSGCRDRWRAFSWRRWWPLVPVSPASAHDVLEGTDPADGSVVASVPAVVRLTFNNTPIALGSEILVKDANGANQADGPVSIVDDHVSKAVKADAPAGRYTVI